MLTKEKNKAGLMKVRWIGTAVLLALYANNSWAFNIDDVAKQAKALAGKASKRLKAIYPLNFVK